MRLAQSKNEKIRCENCGFENNIINKKCANCEVQLRKKRMRSCEIPLPKGSGFLLHRQPLSQRHRGVILHIGQFLP